MLNIGQIQELAKTVLIKKTELDNVPMDRAKICKYTTLENLPPPAIKCSRKLSVNFDSEMAKTGDSTSTDGGSLLDRASLTHREKVDLSSPLFLGLMQSEDTDLPGKEHEEELSFADIVLFHSVSSRIMKDLPVFNLLSLACTSRDFRSLVNRERSRCRRHRFEWMYRKEFIRHLNMSCASYTMTGQDHFFSRLIRELYCYPERILVFYSPDIFQYGVRIMDGGHSRTVKADALLDGLLKQRNDNDWRVWHFRLFTVIQPNSDLVFSSTSTQLTTNELKRFPLWHSEDLVMIFLPTLPNVKIRHHPLTFSMLLNVPEFERDQIRSSLFQYLFVIGQRFRPKLVLLSIRDLPRSVENELIDFPVIIIASRLFDSHGPEGWMSFSGEGVTVFQVILEVSDRRNERDSKIHALHAQLGWIFPTEKKCWIFYFTELWPGGTSKEIPQRDVIRLRSVFQDVPIFGGRTGHLMGNQKLPILAEVPGSDARSLILRATPTIVTVVAFSD